MSFMDKIWDTVKDVQNSFDNWVAKNMSRETQNMIIISVFFGLIIHLVYTKRKFTREAKEKQKEIDSKEEAKLKKKVK